MRIVLIDTCVWVPFFNRPQSPEKKAVDGLLDEDRAALIGPIVAEILQGIPRERNAQYVASLLRGIRYIELGFADWESAARIGRQLVARGHRLPLSDLVEAAIALRLDAEIFTTDPHFDLIDRVRRFSPYGPRCPDVNLLMV
jgi:predicted nucleic acid-binding protein